LFETRVASFIQVTLTILLPSGSPPHNRGHAQPRAHHALKSFPSLPSLFQPRTQIYRTRAAQQQQPGLHAQRKQAGRPLQRRDFTASKVTHSKGWNYNVWQALYASCVVPWWCQKLMVVPTACHTVCLLVGYNAAAGRSFRGQVLLALLALFSLLAFHHLSVIFILTFPTPGAGPPDGSLPGYAARANECWEIHDVHRQWGIVNA